MADAASLHRLEEQLEQDHVKQIHWGILNSRTALSAQEVLQILVAGSWESRLGKYHRALALFWGFYQSFSCWLCQRLSLGLTGLSSEPAQPFLCSCTAQIFLSILPNFSLFEFFYFS